LVFLSVIVSRPNLQATIFFIPRSLIEPETPGGDSIHHVAGEPIRYKPTSVRLVGPYEFPSTGVIINYFTSLKVSLSRSHMMFPELAEVSTVDHSITLIVTQLWQ